MQRIANGREVRDKLLGLLSLWDSNTTEVILLRRHVQVTGDFLAV